MMILKKIFGAEVSQGDPEGYCNQPAGLDFEDLDFFSAICAKAVFTVCRVRKSISRYLSEAARELGNVPEVYSLIRRDFA